MTFGVYLGIDFHEILDFVIICVNHQNAFIQSISVGSAHPKSHIFSLNFNQNFIYFLMPHSGPHFLRFWCDLVPKSSILGAPWRPAGPKMAPKIAQLGPKVEKSSWMDAPYCLSNFQDRFRRAPGHHFGRFWVPFGAQLAAKGLPKSIFLAPSRTKISKNESQNEASKNV